MTLTARDEADLIDEHISFHLAVGVDFIIAADNESTDGTTEIFEKYARAGYLHRLAVSDPFLQIKLVTQLARHASGEYGADWIINSDADEFWYPREGTLKEILATVPARFGSIRGMWRNFVARPDDARSFAERMTIRSQRPVEGLHPFNTHFKTIHRASEDVEVSGGNHDVAGTGVAPLYGWYPLDVLHFPIRSREQFERKFMRHWQVTSKGGKATNPFYDVVQKAQREGRMDELYRTYVIDDAQLARGLADGSLVEDGRLRDALRSLARDRGGSLDLVESRVDAGYLTELGYIEENSQFARAQRRLEALESRAARLESGIGRRFSRRIARYA